LESDEAGWSWLVSVLAGRRKDMTETGVNIGVAFHQWRQLSVRGETKFDAELTTFLLDW